MVRVTKDGVVLDIADHAVTAAVRHGYTVVKAEEPKKAQESVKKEKKTAKK